MTAVRVLGAAAAVVLLAGCTSQAPGPKARAEEQSSLAACPEQSAGPGKGAPLMPALSFDGRGGGPLALAEAPGTPTRVNLWGRWGPPCREEMPLLQELAVAAGGKVQ